MNKMNIDLAKADLQSAFKICFTTDANPLEFDIGNFVKL